MQFVPAGSNEGALARVLIIGEPGTGKTRLAGTFPNPLFVDLENGAETARPGGVNRFIVPTDSNTVAAVNKIINACKKPAQDNTIQFQVNDQSFPVSTLVIDSLDAIQQSIKAFEILRGRTRMERNDWDALMNRMMPLVLGWNSLPIHVVAIAHVKRSNGEGSKPGNMDLAVQGAMRTQMPRWFDYILHVVAGKNGKRHVIIQPMPINGYSYLAKDRHNRLAKLSDSSHIPLPANEDGYPEDRIARIICGLSAAETEQ